MMMKQIYVLVSLVLVAAVEGFAPLQSMPRAPRTILGATETDADPNDIIGRRIQVKGDVNGGYYRSCVSNEGGKFRGLVGTMTPPGDGDEAEIYVEGKRKLVDGFIRWCSRGEVGLNQRASVTGIQEEDPTGLYDGFYVKTH